MPSGTCSPRKLHVIDPGLVTAFKPRPDQDRGHRLETTVFLHGRRQWRRWHYWLGENEIDLCDAEGRTFVNSCWALQDFATIERERNSMTRGHQVMPNATGVLVYHDGNRKELASIPEARPAWHWLLNHPDEAPYLSKT